MGHNRIPTAILDARGSFINRPSRVRPAEPSTDKPIGPPPKWLAKEEKQVWKDLVKQALPGVLMYSDRGAFELLVRLTSKLRKGNMTKSSDMGMFISLCSRFAMTPADRSKVAVESKPKSKLEKFMAPVRPAPSAIPALPELMK
jgi:phage terminase small subunit